MRHLIKVFIITILLSCQKAALNIDVKAVEENGIVGEYLFQKENVQNPIIVVLSGSGKGLLHARELEGLVQEGYDVFSVAYQGQKLLPKRINRIPIEYVKKCIDWAQTKNEGTRKIILLGISRGAELALLYASKFDNIDGLIGYSPSNIVLPDHVGVDDTMPLLSSWTYQGRDIPFANIRRFDDEAGKIRYKKYIDPILKKRVNSSEGFIDVSKIKCPTLLLSGKADLVWPSYEMSEMMVEETERRNTIKSIGYENAGHQFLWFSKGEPTRVATSQSLRLTGIKKHRFLYGGTEEGTKKAMIESRKEVLKFIDFIDNN